MLKVFTAARVQEHVTETEDLFLPMVKKAKRNFPGQESVYEVTKLLLRSQVEFVRSAGCQPVGPNAGPPEWSSQAARTGEFTHSSRSRADIGTLNPTHRT